MENVNQGIHGALDVNHYVKPDNPQTLQKLEWFQDQKLALMMHWGIYSQAGLVESWALSDGDGDWSRGCIDWDTDSNAFKEDYRNLYKSFNPIRFQPDKWADAAKDGGFKYLIFTTKHHDGFCMWDTAHTQYKVTNPQCAFSTNKRADVASHVFEAFRRKGIGIAAYFSKADWHVPHYWAKGQLAGNFFHRGPSYNPEEKPELWEKFVQFTHDQVMELVTEYGRLDILWFDAGWVCRQNNQDIRIEELIEKARKVQPWLLSADRTCGGMAENYITPEQSIPAQPLNVPWESCVTMGNGFAYSYDDTFKSTRTLLRMLIDVCAKGGNLALNVAPQPDGRLPWPALKRMKEMGAWLRQYGEAIYGTRICAPYIPKGFAFTQKEHENTVYAFCLDEAVNKKFTIPYTDKPVKEVVNLSDGQKVPFTQSVNGVELTVENPAPCADFGGEPIAEVFAFRV